MTRQWQTVRVFISSTFRDMNAERDHLIRFVFPRLREELLKRYIHLVDVDLRWGVKSDENALGVCLKIIDECRPRFICILGGRYGSVPAGDRLSITAAEVQYAVLDRLAIKEYRYFYFLDPQVTNSIPETAARTGGYCEFAEADEIKNFGIEKAWALAKERTRKLAALKQAILSSGYTPFIYEARWNHLEQRLVDLEEFGKRVYADLLESINDELGTAPMEALDEFSVEDAAEEAFIEEHGQRYIIGSRQPLLDALNRFAGSGGRPALLVLTGKTGLGKSALLCKFYRDYTKAHPNEIIIQHFTGASTGSTDLRRTLRRFYHDLALAAGSREEIPQDVDELTQQFPILLAQAAASHRILLLIDALNQFDPTDNAHAMAWLPESLPSGVHIIVSSLEHPALEALRCRTDRPPEIELRPLDQADARAIVTAFLDYYHKGMNSEQVEALLEKTESGSPLYLLVALEELRTLGIYEILQRIRLLPGEVGRLFLWILKERLSQDPGFRDPAGRLIGAELVRRFVSLLGVSRHGLSEAELADLVDPGDPLGNLAALQRLLRPYLMHRGKLLDFFHAQLRQAVELEYLDEEPERLEAHRILADYFRHRADPGGQQDWQPDARPLAELPFHLAHGNGQMELYSLFSQLSYLAARVAAGQVHEQLADFSLAGSSLPTALVEWQAFLQKHAQRLSENPGMLVALVNHEGFAGARQQVAALPWRQPWLRSFLEPMPLSTAHVTEGLHVKVSGNLDLQWGRVSALASQRYILFCAEHLGGIRVIDAQAMRQSETILSIRRERLLVLACAPDATSLAVFYESGQAELYRCIFDWDGWPFRLELAAGFSFLLPEFNDPFVTWHEGSCWFQAGPATLGRVSLESPQVSKEPLPHGETGELSALLFDGSSRLVALRQGRDTLLLASGAPPLRRPGLDLCSACACSGQGFAVAFSDGTLAVYGNGPTLTPKNIAHAGMLRGALGWDGARLLWLSESESRGFTAWRPGECPLLPVQDNQEVFPLGLQVVPCQWLARPDGSLLLVTSLSLVSFQLLEGGASTGGRLEQVFGGPVWRAVVWRDKEQWLLESQPLRELFLGKWAGRLYCTPDGQGRFFGSEGTGPGFVMNLGTLQPTLLQDCPPGLNMVVGEPDGGCWFIDRPGDIYFADARGRCSCAARINLPDVSGAQLVNCANHLIWYGYSTQFFPDTGADAARTFVFFRKRPGSLPKLERLGEQFRPPRDGLCLALCYAEPTGELVTFWEISAQGLATHLLRIARPDQFLAWQFRETLVTGEGVIRFTQASLSADARYLGIVNMAGEFSCLDITGGQVVATLAGSSPFTAVAPGAKGPQFWLVEGRRQVFGCTLVGR